MRTALLVPALEYEEAWDWAFDIQAEALRGAGIYVEPRAWSDPGDLSGFDLVMPLVAWGYHRNPHRWQALLDRLEANGPLTLNPIPLLRWNSDKTYLTELFIRGIPTVPTTVVSLLDNDALEDARADYGTELVIKPLVSAGADGTHRLSATDRVPMSAMGQTMMIQPFLPSIIDEGEYSLMLFGGRFSHAIVKRPKQDDYRVQPMFGGTDMACDPPEGSIDLAKAALAAAPSEAVYARVDMVRGTDGELKIIELELIEPALWLEHSPDKGASFAAAILERARQ